MLMQAEPVYLAYKDIEERIQKRIQNAKMQNARNGRTRCGSESAECKG